MALQYRDLADRQGMMDACAQARDSRATAEGYKEIADELERLGKLEASMVAQQGSELILEESILHETDYCVLVYRSELDRLRRIEAEHQGCAEEKASLVRERDEARVQRYDAYRALDELRIWMEAVGRHREALNKLQCLDPRKEELKP